MDKRPGEALVKRAGHIRWKEEIYSTVESRSERGGGGGSQFFLNWLWDWISSRDTDRRRESAEGKQQNGIARFSLSGEEFFLPPLFSYPTKIRSEAIMGEAAQGLCGWVMVSRCSHIITPAPPHVLT